MSLQMLRSFRGVWPVVKLADDTYINDISEINVLHMRQRCSRLWRGTGSDFAVYSRRFSCFLVGADRSIEYDMMPHRRSLDTSLQWRGHIHRERSRTVPSTTCCWWPEYHLSVRRNTCLPLLYRASSIVRLPHRHPTGVRRDPYQLNGQPHSLLLQHKVSRQTLISTAGRRLSQTRSWLPYLVSYCPRRAQSTTAIYQMAPSRMSSY